MCVCVLYICMYCISDYSGLNLFFFIAYNELPCVTRESQMNFLLDGCVCTCCGFRRPTGRLTGMNGWSSKGRWRSRRSLGAAIKGPMLLWGTTAVDHKWLLWCCKGQSGSMGWVMKMEAMGPQRATWSSPSWGKSAEPFRIRNIWCLKQHWDGLKVSQSFLTIWRWRYSSFFLDQSCSKGRVCAAAILQYPNCSNEDFTWHFILKVWQSWCQNRLVTFDTVDYDYL